MTDERLRVLEQAFRASGDPVDLGRWLIEAQRCGLEVDLGPLELAASCGSEAAAFALGSERIPSHVACFRSLCRALRSCRQGKRARGHLAAMLVRDLEPTSPSQAVAQGVLARELVRWIDVRRNPRERQAKCLGLVGASESGPDPFARAYRRAVFVMSPNTRASTWALENLMSLVASGWVVGTKEMLWAERERRMAILERAQRRLEAWAFGEVARTLARAPA